MKVAVTACSGRLGSRLLKLLAADIGPDNVVGICRNPAEVSIQDIEIRAGDYHSEEQMREALTGVDSLICISLPVSPEDRVALHNNVFEAARHAGVKQALYTSVIGNGKEKGTHYEPVQQVNRQTEEALKASGLNWIIARNGLYLDLDVAHIVNAGKGDSVFRNNGGSGRCGYITIDELAFAIAKLAISDQHGKTFNLVGDCHTQAELVELVNEVFGFKVRFETISDQECIDKIAADRGEIVARMLAGCYQCIREGAFDVPSDFETAAGRAVLPIRTQMEKIKQDLS
ncbi:MAG: NAD(P)H-binding protein [Gammaproteobacteria bacterium]